MFHIARVARIARFSRSIYLPLAILVALVAGPLTRAPAPAGAAPAAPEAPSRVAGTAGAGARLREAPGLDATVALVIPEGAIVVRTGAVQAADGYDWAPVRHGTARGWVATIFLVDEGATPSGPTDQPLVATTIRTTGPLAVGGHATVVNTGGIACASVPPPVSTRRCVPTHRPGPPC